MDVICYPYKSYFCIFWHCHSSTPSFNFIQLFFIFIIISYALKLAANIFVYNSDNPLLKIDDNLVRLHRFSLLYENLTTCPVAACIMIHMVKGRQYSAYAH